MTDLHLPHMDVESNSGSQEQKPEAKPSKEGVSGGTANASNTAKNLSDTLAALKEGVLRDEAVVGLLPVGEQSDPEPPVDPRDDDGFLERCQWAPATAAELQEKRLSQVRSLQRFRLILHHKRMPVVHRLPP